MSAKELADLFADDTPQQFVTRNLDGLWTLCQNLDEDDREKARVSLWVMARYLECPYMTIEELLEGAFGDDVRH